LKMPLTSGSIKGIFNVTLLNALLKKAKLPAVVAN